MYDAGLWTTHDAVDPKLTNTFPRIWQRTPVCSNFKNSGIVAESQAQSPATDIYVTNEPDFLKKYFLQSTILHEALHNLTGLRDDDLASLLGITLDGSVSFPINTVLVANGCALK
jgi:hypothetical protein